MENLMELLLKGKQIDADAIRNKALITTLVSNKSSNPESKSHREVA